MKIIFNADDFGYSKGINLGILEAHINGVVNSTTIMANMPDFEHAAGLARQHTGLKVGIHLNLTTGQALGSGYKTITDENGEFFNPLKLEQYSKNSKIDLAEIENEYRLQIKKVADYGISFTHFDGHHHSHIFHGIIDITIKLAKEYALPVRLYERERHPQIKSVNFIKSFFGGNVTIEHLAEIFAKLERDSEIMCHPGYVDEFLYSSSGYSIGRAKELSVLTNPYLKELLEKYGHQSASYQDV